MEDTISLKDIIVKMLRKWRIIIVVSILFGVVFSGAKFFLDSSSKPNAVEIDYETQKYELDTKLYNHQAENFTNTILKATNAIESINSYIQHSTLMKIDSYNKPISSATIFISDAHSSNSKLDLIFAAYSNIFSSEQLFATLSAKYNFVDSKYLRELVVFTSPEGTSSSHSMQIDVTHNDSETASNILSDILTYLNDSKAYISKTIGEHELIVTQKNAYTAIDSDLQTLQNIQNNQLSTFMNQITVSNNALLALVKPKIPNISIYNPIVESIKYGIVGVFVGGILSCITVLMIILISPLAMSEDELVMRYNTKILGNLSSAKRRKD